VQTTTKKTQRSDHQDFTPALGSSKLTPIYDSVIALLTRERVWRSRVVAAASPHLVGRVLDVGCGTGSLAIALGRKAERSVTIHGLDPDPEVLQRAKRKANAFGLKVRLYNGFLNREFLDRYGPFNVVLSTLVLHQTPLVEKRRILGLAYEALADGGRLVIADYGLQATRIMRFLFRHTVQRIDGVSDTQPNADGVLPKLIKNAGFLIQEPSNDLPTLTGSISIIVAKKPNRALDLTFRTGVGSEAVTRAGF
jgi:ubiquinone/menaquinone biosynthesis C-methylase UbiE